MNANSFFLSVAALTLASIATVQAAPTLDGMTLHLPDNGWYQVQNSDTYEQVCAGVRTCDIEAGTYTAINHTTGERFENIVVSSAPPVNDIVVSDNTISWPDDGWYQVTSLYISHSYSGLSLA